MSADSISWLVLTVNYVVQDGKSNWLEGMILMCEYSPDSCRLPLPASWLINILGLYAIIAVTFSYYPVSEPTGHLGTCE